MTTVLLVVAVALIVAAFCALAWWTHRSERDIGYDKPGIPAEQSDALRFGIVVSATQSFSSGQ